jgi:hypothetical protein
MRDAKTYARNTVLVAAVALLVTIGINIFNSSRTASRGPDTTVVGTLQDWGKIGRRKSPTLRFRLQEYVPDFRVDPGLFRETMHKEIPPTFRTEATVEVVVSAIEMQSPSRPTLNTDEPIVWVRGLSVDGVQLIRSTDSKAWDRKNAAWGYALVLAALAFLVYSYAKWTKLRAAV